VNGDEVVGSNELIKLEEMDMAALAALGGVEHNEEVVGIGVDLGHLVALNTVSDGEGMEAKHLRQHLGCLLVVFGDVDLLQPIGSFEQSRRFVDGMLLNAVVGYQPDVHPAHPFLDHVQPT
jgi:hypothetical protein